MIHKHRAVSTERARALSAHSQLMVTHFFGECGAFKLADWERWVKPHGPPQIELSAG